MTVPSHTHLFLDLFLVDVLQKWLINLLVQAHANLLIEQTLTVLKVCLYPVRLILLYSLKMLDRFGVIDISNKAHLKIIYFFLSSIHALADIDPKYNQIQLPFVSLFRFSLLLH